MHGGVRNIAWALLALFVIGIWRPLPLVRHLTQREASGGSAQRCFAWPSSRSSSRPAPRVAHGHWPSSAAAPSTVCRSGCWHARWRPSGCIPSGHASTAFGFRHAGRRRRDAPTHARRRESAVVPDGRGRRRIRLGADDARRTPCEPLALDGLDLLGRDGGVVSLAAGLARPRWARCAGRSRNAEP